MQLPVIVLDPGHGGEDPGAISKSGRFERDAALEMALTAKFLLAMNGWDVRLTRDGSEKVKPDLHRRVWLAEQVKAKALVSIHYNSQGTYPCVYFAPGWASLKLARTLAALSRIPDDKVWASTHSRFGQLYIDALRDEVPAILWEVSSIDAAPAAGPLGKVLRTAFARRLVKAVEYLK
jgi:N-acetylmuramoyl-L-alanine amidase